MQCSWQRTWKKSSKSWIFSNGFWAVYLKKWVGLLFDLAQCSKGMNSTGQWTLMRGWKLEDEFRFKTGCIVGYPWLCSLAIAKWAGPVCNCKGLVTSPPSSQNLALNRNIGHQINPAGVQYPGPKGYPCYGYSNGYSDVTWQVTTPSLILSYFCVI